MGTQAVGARFKAPGALTRTRSAKSVADEPPEKAQKREEPPKDEGGAALLSRLLSRSTSNLASAPAPSPLGSEMFTSFSMLGGEDLFSYLKTEPVGLPELPGLSSAASNAAGEGIGDAGSSRE